MKTPITILILLCCILSSCTQRIVRDNTIQIQPEYIRLHYNVDTRHIHVISNPPGVDVSFETDESWIILPDVASMTTPAYVSITVDPNMTPGWRTGYVRFHSGGFSDAMLEITQVGESVMSINRIFPN